MKNSFSYWWARIFTVLIFSLLLVACGGGGGDSDRSSSPTGSSDWDRMVWDQDNWR